MPSIGDAEWPRNEIDRFILAALEERELRPSSPADRRTLIRRLHFDLIGLPPSPDEVDEFVRSEDPRAYERLVDRLLESPHYGERWARHWLDVIGFGESDGFFRNWLRPHAWRYRDWVVQALNDDMPYGEFVRMQLAGDVLGAEDPGAAIATGYLVGRPFDQESETMGSPAMQRASRHDQLEAKVANLGRVFLGLSVDCARCHDHVFDPISQQDYYRLAAAVEGYRHDLGEPRELVGLPETHPRRRQLAESMRPLRAQAAAIDGSIRERLRERAQAEHARRVSAARSEARTVRSKLRGLVEQAEYRWIDSRTGLPVTTPDVAPPRRMWPSVAALVAGLLLLSLGVPSVRHRMRRVVRPQVPASFELKPFANEQGLLQRSYFGSSGESGGSRHPTSS